MPQMAPLWWEILYLTFIILFLMMNTIMFFSFNKKIKTSITSTNIKTLNWKW
uniref:ATPase subunit 8 n=1 Tax=Macropes robustus TaxID=2813415 RepID=A0A8T9ZX48_9HEMI|nr:ATPase subunit 8 [Macropes robustus]